MVDIETGLVKVAKKKQKMSERIVTPASRYAEHDGAVRFSRGFAINYVGW